ncbi:bifunctional diguanylate cyclase/phosphodiesterase [Noviherbaspirillum saxi]|uniref:Bifunctional diguanylate cyclase/phosphodiesterase n=1 Tax=Noviherbaspirillum saxi TaxID=2320863 RepID=A0A3A3FV32_9BURK|nr:bifunctional diguanylate cyclase/phosphodiesterase [Noviherbaspirillum saxi]RJF98418.1 bifunctional diguanylate cyclase/phosphodiesterase [Noviherbaspirillum saxi]
MHKAINSRLLLIMFLVGAASGFFVSLTGWWGLHDGSIQLDNLRDHFIRIAGPGMASAPADAALLRAVNNNLSARRLLLAMSGFATVCFCLTAWLTYRESMTRRRQADELQRQHNLFRTLFEGTNEGVILTTAGKVTDCNRAALLLFDLAGVDTMRALGPAQLQPPRQPDGSDSVAGFLAYLNAAERTGPQAFEWQFQSLNHRHFPAEVAIHTATVCGEEVTQITIRDISLRAQAEKSMRLANQAFENSREGVAITDEHANILTVNRAFTVITGYTPEEAFGRNPRILSFGRQTREFYQQMWDSVRTTGNWQGEVWNKRKDGAVYPQWLNISRLSDSNGRITNYVGVFSDLSETKLAEERLLHQTNYDALTDLPNRALLAKRLQQAMISAGRHVQENIGVLLLDLDRFKLINDSIGHEAGDSLLLQVSHRLRRVLRESDTLARMGGDEFALLAIDIRDADHLASLAQKLIKALHEPFHLHSHELHIGASIGLALYPDHGTDVDTLIKHADIALYHAKTLGRHRYEFYANHLDQLTQGRLQLESSLYGAVARNELLLQFQPQQIISNGKIHGVEALVRWHHAELGMVSPALFIPLAEETGLIVSIGEWILRTACTEARRWLLQGHPARIAVNVSARQFHDTAFADMVECILRDSGLPAPLLELELTEGMVMEDTAQATAILNELHSLGVQISIDDFGTGYSSLSYLKRLPIQILKIDQSFVRDIATDQDDRAIVSAIIVLAHSLGLQVVAEGVENAEQLGFLREHGCDAMQGYYFSRPVPAEQLLQLLIGERTSVACES